ncbi:MAG: hypothetical protein NTY02_05725 [Acidobacteria bacterium]|nr:hypothetical protein [Acidobacteriota bacterium]
MDTTSTVFLGIIAFSTLVMAVVQIGVIVYVARLAKRVDELSQQIQREIGPLADRLTKVAESLQHATSMAAVQVDRIDRLFSSATRRAEDTMSLVQGAVMGPVREGLAVIAAIRGVVGAFRSFRGKDAGARGTTRFDDEDPLFIG